jgi:hypothetical protein
MPLSPNRMCENIWTLPPLVAVARLLLPETQVDAAERPRHGNQGGCGMAGFFFGRNGSRAA